MNVADREAVISTEVTSFNINFVDNIVAEVDEVFGRSAGEFVDVAGDHLTGALIRYSSLRVDSAFAVTLIETAVRVMGSLADLGIEARDFLVSVRHILGKLLNFGLLFFTYLTKVFALAADTSEAVGCVIDT